MTPGRRTIGKGGTATLLLLAIVALLPAAAVNGGGALPLGPPETTYAAADAPCGGEPLPDPDRVITGAFGPAQQGAYVMLPFDVPEGTDAVRVKYCHDQPLLASLPEADRLTKHTLDIGLYGPRSEAGEVWGVDEFRGWGGSSRKDVTLSPEGTFDPDPAPVASEKTTVGFRPGPIDPGRWAVELGVAAVGEELATEDGRVEWRVEVDLIDDPTYADEPYEPVAYNEAPARSEPGWYAGDFHVHARHSNPKDATMRETFGYAFAPLGEGAGLDFITLSDYVTDRHWGEIGAFQANYRRRLIVRSSELITYRGHVNSHAPGELTDYRTGPILLRRDDGTLETLRPARPAREIFDQIHAAGGWTQINHPTIFPSAVPTFENFCRGCPWDYSDAKTDYSKVDAIEVATGPAGLQADPNPGPNPFTPLAVQFYEEALDANGKNLNRIAAVGSSDSHNAGTPDDPVTQSPIGQATTVVKADELSEQGIGDGVRAGHTYVKVWGNDGPDLRFEARAPGLGDPPAIMGDTLEADSAVFTAKVSNLEQAQANYPGVYTLVVVRDGLPMAAVPIPPGGDEFSFDFPSLGHGRYGIRVHRLATGVASIDVVSTPIWLAAPGPDDGGDGGEGDGGEGGGGDGGGGDGRNAGSRAGCRGPLVGTHGDDRLIGTHGRDEIRARRGDDRVRGKRGCDCLFGGRGADRIAAGGGRDRVRAGGGADRVRTADGQRDVVRCGRGSDRVRVDRQDRAVACERVRAGRRPRPGG